MELDKFLSVALILGGATIMFLSIIKYISIFHGTGLIKIKVNSITQNLYLILICLMCFFLCGYFGAAYCYALNVKFINRFMIGAIFFLGSIFVLIGVILQIRMLNFIRTTTLQTIKMLINAIEARDPYLKGHSEHVANLVVTIYKNLPVEYRKNFYVDLETLEYAGLLHDIGKLGVPKEILYKPGLLNEDEWEIIKEHPRIGKKILSSVEGFENISMWIYYHHERLDGKGYYKVKDNDIPWVSKLIAVADTFSALVTDRSYRKGTSYEKAIEIMSEVSGSQLDSEIFQCFTRINKEDIYECKPISLLKLNS